MIGVANTRETSREERVPPVRAWLTVDRVGTGRDKCGRRLRINVTNGIEMTLRVIVTLVTEWPKRFFSRTAVRDVIPEAMKLIKPLLDVDS